MVTVKTTRNFPKKHRYLPVPSERAGMAAVVSWWAAWYRDRRLIELREPELRAAAAILMQLSVAARILPGCAS